MLSVLYIVPAISYTSKGILKKQYDKVKAFETAGCSVKALFFSDSLGKSFTEGNIHHHAVDLSQVKKKYAKKIIWRVLPYFLSRAANKIILAETAGHLHNIDVVYIRYSLADVNTIELCKLIKSKGIKIAFEYNAHHYFDEKMNVKANRSFYTSYRFYNEKFLQARFARFADLIVGVTHELSDYYGSLNPAAVRYTLSNGIEPERFPSRNPPAYDGSGIMCLFLSGSVNYWHGLDRFLNGLKQYKGNKKIHLTVAGLAHQEYRSYRYANKNVSVDFTESADGEELNSLFNTHHIGIGSLALHRMGLKEASVLKVREYIARGIPFILGYNDTDLMNAPEFRSYYIKVPADESSVNIEELLRFADSVLKDEHYSAKMRAIGAPLVDYKPKIRGLVRTMEKLKVSAN
jgi:hypothetical protein